MFPGRKNFKDVFNFFSVRFLHQEHKIHVNGFNINYIQVGNGEKTLMLLPGALGTAWTDFRPQLESLPELLPNHKIIAWDPPGYGKSIPPNRNVGPDRFYNDAKIAVNTMRALFRQNFSLMGWNAGALTATIIANCFPEFVDRLILWGAGAHLNGKDNITIEASMYINNWSQGLREPYERAYFKKQFDGSLPKCIDCQINLYKMRNGNICSKEAKNVRAPTFILRGAKDPFWSLEHVPYLMQKLPVCKYHEFPNGKHNIHLRYPDEFNKMVAEFLVQNKKDLQRISSDEIYVKNENNFSSKFERNSFQKISQ